MILPFGVMLAISFILIPFAWLLSIPHKLAVIRDSSPSDSSKAKYDLIAFIFLGPFILALDVLIGDVRYFWMNNFR